MVNAEDGEDEPVIDVHPPHEPVHGWRDFFLHLVTITIGLLIALSLEGMVEWEHHRHLVHEAEASLRGEIRNNARKVLTAMETVHKQQTALKQDVEVLQYIAANKKAPENGSLDISFSIVTMDSVSWQTAEATGALAYMPYAAAQEYADIYNSQRMLESAEVQAARDAIVSLAPFSNTGKGRADPTEGQAVPVREKIEVLEGQLLLVDALMRSLDKDYSRFLASHPE